MRSLGYAKQKKGSSNYNKTKRQKKQAQKTADKTCLKENIAIVATITKAAETDGCLAKQ